jgi:GIY-YIG catalytic domain
MNEEKYLQELMLNLCDKKNWQSIQLTKEWTNAIPNVAGVYALKQSDNNSIVYVGETGNLRGRLKDLLDSRHHTVRRTIGEKFYSQIEGYESATSKLKFPSHIEVLVNEHICKKLSIAYIEVKLGRKELEENVQESIDISQRLNKRSKRKKS